MDKGRGCPVVQFTTSSDRVKMVDMHPKEPIFICALYTGIVTLWNYDTQTLVRSFDTGTAGPVRCARFITRLQSFICGADDMHVRVYNYNTMERTKVFHAHDDYIRGIAVHDQLTLVFTCSDDMTIRQWDWSKDWECVMIHEGHMHYCMAVALNPKDPSTFATASLDSTVKVWSITTSLPNYQLEGHEDGVNCVEYYPRGDKPYLLSGSDDQTVRLWDYQTKACLQVFNFHMGNVTGVAFHPDQPLIFTVAEDMEMKVISSETFRLLHNLDHSRMSRAWTMTAKRFTNALVVGYDNGVIVYKVGTDKPVYSMDTQGRLFVLEGNDVTRIDIKGIPDDTPDGETLNFPSKDVGALESSAQSLLHGPGGQFIATTGERDYTIVSSLSLRSKCYGQCMSFTWGPDNGSYAILESPMTVKVFKGFKERATLSLLESADQLFGGPLFGVRTTSSVIFYDWATLSVVRQIDECPKAVKWNAGGDMLALLTGSAIFLLRFNAEQVAEYMEHHAHHTDAELDFAFDLVEQVEEKAKEVTWVGDCLVFISLSNRLSYYIGGEISSIAALSRSQYLLGYLPKEDRIFCVDREKNITSYLFKANMIEYMAAIVRGDLETAAMLLPSIDNKLRYNLAKFVQARGLLELALEITTEEDHRFDLAIQLKKLSLAQAIAERSPSVARWKQVGDIALVQGHFELAIRSFWQCSDYSGLLLIFSCLNDTESIGQLGEKCFLAGKANMAFTCFHLSRHFEKCVDILCETGKPGDAAFYARTYCQGKIEDVVNKWKVSLASVPRIRDVIATPSEYPNLFPMLQSMPSPMMVDTATEEVVPSSPAAPVAMDDHHTIGGLEQGDASREVDDIRRSLPEQTVGIAESVVLQNVSGSADTPAFIHQPTSAELVNPEGDPAYANRVVEYEENTPGKTQHVALENESYPMDTSGTADDEWGN